MPRVLLVDGKAVANERVGGALHALACESVDAGDLGPLAGPFPITSSTCHRVSVWPAGFAIAFPAAIRGPCRRNAWTTRP